jgi:hypothetical protein
MKVGNIARTVFFRTNAKGVPPGKTDGIKSADEARVEIKWHSRVRGGAL